LGDNQVSESILYGLISTNRFILKPLAIRDVTDRYAGWLNDASTNQFISAKLTQAELEKYVRERLNREDVLFLGIFNKNDGLHIGNIKYEPIDSQQGYAVMGILIGEAIWRGKNVAGEVILASAFWLNKNKNINQIILGVSRLNLAAIRAYQKIGFIEKPFEHLPNTGNKNTTMILDLKSFIRAY
jgi:RimJ/RimL family protein N-acetyltransferase